MPTSLPNPYGPSTQIGSGLQSISNAIFNMGRAHNMRGYARQRSAAQDAADLANAELRGAMQRKYEAEAMGLEQANIGASPESAHQLGQMVSGLPADVFRRATDLTQGGMPEGPIPEYGDITPAHMQRANQGRLASTKFLADPKGNFNELFKALQTHQQTQDYTRALNGELPTDTLGDATAALEGKARYGMRDGMQYSTQVAGNTHTTPLGTAKIESEKSLAGLRGKQGKEADARSGKLQEETKNLTEGFFGPEAIIDVNGVPSPRFLGQVAGKQGIVSAAKPKAFDPSKSGPGGANDLNHPKNRKSISKAEYDMLNNQISDLAGTHFDKLGPESRGQILSYATELVVNPNSPWHRNPLGAMEAAVKAMAPEGFKDAAGLFSSARYEPVGGVRPTPAPPGARPGTTPANKAPTDSSSLPAAAVAQLREGESVTFGNGQTWTLQNGTPVQVR